MPKEVIRTNVLKKLVVTFILSFVIVAFLALIDSRQEINLTQPEKDFTNKEEGTVVMFITINDLDLPKGIKYFTFFKSKLLQGISIKYAVEELKLKAGAPLMNSEELNIIGKHMIAYTYKKGDKQALYFDGEKVASSSFNVGLVFPLTGFVVLEGTEFIKPSELRLYNKALTEEELKGFKKSI